MSEDKRHRKSRVLEAGVEELHLHNGHTKRDRGRSRTDEIKEESASSSGHSPQDTSMNSASQSPIKHSKLSQSPHTGSETHEEVVGGDVTVKQEPGQPPKLARSSSQKIVSRPPPLFDDYADKTEEARGTFQLLSECAYSSKYIGSTEHGSMDCDCAEEWGKAASTFFSNFGWTNY